MNTACGRHGKRCRDRRFGGGHDAGLSHIGGRSGQAGNSALPFGNPHLQAAFRVKVNGDFAPRVPNTSNLSFQGVDGESIVIAMDLDGICISTGSACSRVTRNLRTY